MDKNVRTSSGLAAIAIIIASLALLAILAFRGKMLGSAITSSDGAALYNGHCAVCHGESGKGDGPVAALLDPRPRDFSIGKYRLISTTNGIPSKSDIIRTIRNGMPGTSMTAWRHLSDHDVELLADQTFAFTKDAMKQQLAAKKLKTAVLE